jgi:ATP-binding cassette subfamily B protein/subfamily B ATP-binding cassette protein MsbA
MDSEALRAVGWAVAAEPEMTPEAVAARSRTRVMWDLYRTFGPHLVPYWRWFAVGYAAMGASVLTRVLTPFPLKWILDHVLLGKPLPEGRLSGWLSLFAADPPTLLLCLCAAMVALVFFQGAFSYVQRFLISSAARLANNDIRNHVFHRLQLLPLAFHGKLSPGDLVVRLTDDVNTLRRLLVDSTTELLRMAFGFVSVLVLMASVDWQLTLLALAVAPPIYWLASRFRGRVEELALVTRTRESEIGAIVQENISSMAAVQAFSRQDDERQRFENETRASMLADIRRLRLSRGFGRAIELLVAIGTASVVYYAGLRALSGRLEATDLVLFVPWLKDLYSPLQRLAELLLELTRQVVSGERIAELLRTELTIRDADDAIEAPPLRGEIQFDRVSFGYRTGVPVLRELCFHARPGQLVALVGSSGAGKSTVVNLLLRLFDPWEGAIRFDGVDIRRFKLHSLRRQINVVLQDTLLLRRSVRDNIAFGRPEASLEDVVAAARAAQIHDFVTSLPDGYDTLLSDKARDLSGGQRQRLALARAILREAPILILDEPVSAVDAITEARLDETIAQVTKGRTALIVAHRLATIQRADLILVIEDGRVAEQGTHAELVASSGRYRALYETQYRRPASDKRTGSGRS